MRKIYIVLTYTGTILSKLVKMYTKREFSHVSIALDEDLKEMYSFGRINPYNPFKAGFVHEGINRGTFKRFKKTKTRIYSLQVKDEQFDNVVKVINDMKNNKYEYRFNILGLIGVVVHFRIKREKHFYCAEFVKYVLEKSNIVYNLPELIKPEDFKDIDNLNVIYTGILKEYGR
ncbi:MAG: hypothetical protein ACI4XM_04890 [Candidatus Coprovivens sp.]